MLQDGLEVKPSLLLRFSLINRITRTCQTTSLCPFSQHQHEWRPLRDHFAGTGKHARVQGVM